VHIAVGVFFILFSLIILNNMQVGFSRIPGLDVYAELEAILEIKKSGHWELENESHNSVTPYPGVHLLAAGLNLISGIRLTQMAIWGGFYFRLVLLAVFYVICRRLLPTRQSIFFCLIGFVFLWQVSHQARFGRFPYSNILFFIFTFITLVGYHKKKMIILAILLPSIVLSHPFSRVVTLLFIISIFVTYNLLVWEHPYEDRIKMPSLEKPQLYSISTILLFITLIIFHIMYIKFSSSNLLFLAIYNGAEFISEGINVFSGQPGVNQGSTVATSQISYQIRNKIFVHLQILLVGFTLAIGIVGIQDFSDSLLYSILVFLGMLAIGNVFIYMFDIVHIFRFTVFFWPLMLIICCYILSSYSFEVLSIILILLIVTSSIFGYYPQLYDTEIESGSDTPGVPPKYDRYLTEQMRSTSDFPIRGGTIVSNDYIELAFYKSDFRFYNDIGFYESRYQSDITYDWFITGKADIGHIFARTGNDDDYGITTDQLDKYDQCSNLNKVSTNGAVRIFRISGKDCSYSSL
jgi:hypothetical protein